MMNTVILFMWSLIFATTREAACSRDVEVLFDVLFRSYRKTRRPVKTPGQKVLVKLKLKLSRIIDVHEKDQTVTTSVWLKQQWSDYELAWNPATYGGVKVLFIPADLIWVPDIVLYNNADITKIRMQTRATVYYNGTIYWEVPAVYRSVCPMDVEWFPYDEQYCNMKFGSWTYDFRALDLSHMDPEETWETETPTFDLADNISKVQDGIDLSGYYPSVEWDILEVPARRHNRYYDSCCPDSGSYVDITYYMRIRRKPLFYTVNLVVPCVVICLLTMLVFYLPSESGRKITFSTYLLVAQTLFFLLLTEIIPATSLVLPLIGKYLLFTLCMVCLSVFLSLFTQYIHYRTPATHRMSGWRRDIFLFTLPRLLCIHKGTECSKKFKHRPSTYTPAQPMVLDLKEDESQCPTLRRYSRNLDYLQHMDDPYEAFHEDNHLMLPPDYTTNTIYVNQFRRVHYAPKLPQRHRHQHDPRCRAEYEQRLVARMCRNVCFIASLIDNREQEKEVIEEWQCVALVLNRIFLYIFTVLCVGGTFYFFILTNHFTIMPIQIPPQRSET